MHDELAKLDSLRQQGILSEDAYWDARSRLHAPPATTYAPSTSYAAAPVYELTYPAAVPPSLQSLPYETRSARHQQRRRRRPVLLVVASLVLVLAGAGVGAYFLWLRDTTVTVDATYVLEDNATAQAGCVGQGANSSIATGAKVRLFDGRNHELAHAALPKGTADADNCTFHLQFADVTDEVDSYSLVVPGFPRETMTRRELTSNGWKFTVKQAPPTGPVTGTLELSDFDTALNDCSGTGGYYDIDEGADVIIRDQDSRILGSGSLDAGTSDNYSTCSYTFTVDNVRRDQTQYTVEVSHRGEITASRDEMSSRGWTFSLTLGD